MRLVDYSGGYNVIIEVLISKREKVGEGEGDAAGKGVEDGLMLS